MLAVVWPYTSLWTGSLNVHQLRNEIMLMMVNDIAHSLYSDIVVFSYLIDVTITYGKLNFAHSISIYMTTVTCD